MADRENRRSIYTLVQMKSEPRAGRTIAPAHNTASDLRFPRKLAASRLDTKRGHVQYRQDNSPDVRYRQNVLATSPPP